MPCRPQGDEGDCGAVALLSRRARATFRAMSQHEARAVEVTLARMAAHVDADPRLHAELLRAHREFFGDEVGGAAAEQRFREWFLLERDSEVLGAVPVEVPPFARDGRDLGASCAGVFVVAIGDDEDVEARDLQDDEVYELSVPKGSLRLGDMVVGRLFPTGGGAWAPSAAAAVFRPGGQLAEAFRRDVERIGLDRRLRQIELEHLLLRRPDHTPSPNAAPVDDAPLEHLEADLDALLRASGSAGSATSLSASLAEAERPGQVLGPVLEQLAFDTDIDLDAVRELLLRIWNAHHAGRLPGPPPPGAPADETLGERLVRTLDQGLREKRDVEELFAQLERMAGIDGDEDDDEPADDAAPARPHRGGDGDDDEEVEPDDDDDQGAGAAASLDGDLEPLIEEYLWETGRTDAPEAATLRQWVLLQGNAAVPHTDLEQVTATDLLRLLLHCYLRAEPQLRAAAVRAAFAELERFYAWVAETQELSLGATLQQCRAPFVAQVDRLAAASLLLSTAASSDARPAFLEVEDLGAGGCGVRDDDGDHHWLAAPDAAVAQLRTGDLVLGALTRTDGAATLAGLVVVLPTEARNLME